MERLLAGHYQAVWGFTVRKKSGRSGAKWVNDIFFFFFPFLSLAALGLCWPDAWHDVLYPFQLPFFRSSSKTPKLCWQHHTSSPTCYRHCWVWSTSMLTGYCIGCAAHTRGCLMCMHTHSPHTCMHARTQAHTYTHDPWSHMLPHITQC